MYNGEEAEGHKLSLHVQCRWIAKAQRDWKCSTPKGLGLQNMQCHRRSGMANVHLHHPRMVVTLVRLDRRIHSCHRTLLPNEPVQTMWLSEPHIIITKNTIMCCRICTKRSFPKKSPTLKHCKRIPFRNLDRRKGCAYLPMHGPETPHCSARSPSWSNRSLRWAHILRRQSALRLSCQPASHPLLWRDATGVRASFTRNYQKTAGAKLNTSTISTRWLKYEIWKALHRTGTSSVLLTLTGTTGIIHSWHVNS